MDLTSKGMKRKSFSSENSADEDGSSNKMAKSAPMQQAPLQNSDFVYFYNNDNDMPFFDVVSQYSYYSQQVQQEVPHQEVPQQEVAEQYKPVAPMPPSAPSASSEQKKKKRNRYWDPEYPVQPPITNRSRTVELKDTMTALEVLKNRKGSLYSADTKNRYAIIAATGRVVTSAHLKNKVKELGIEWEY